MPSLLYIIITCRLLCGTQVYADEIFKHPSANYIKTVIQPSGLNLNIFYDNTKGRVPIRIDVPRLPPLKAYYELTTQYSYYDGKILSFGPGAPQESGIPFR